METKISKDEVRHVATLARLELSEPEELLLTQQMNSILSYMDKLNELNTNDVPATSNVIQLVNVYRQDMVKCSLDREQALDNAPQSDGANFLVPKVI
jgi:aspartyl-tRNA(Asn)/glutamyl-tRNA(Gln) amidotransferase subunit C